MVKARKYSVIKNFQGFPKRTDFKIVEEELPQLSNGEILVKTEWISVDPYLSVYPPMLGHKPPYDQIGFQVGIVEESKNPAFPVGERVVSHEGWRDYTIINFKEKEGLGAIIYKLPDLLGLPSSLGIGALGMPGVSAYYGFLDICKPKAGETVVVTGAAGAVGSVVGQIAKIKGCRVIGFAGSDEKVAWLEKELGFDKAFNYKTVDANKVLKEAAPNGVDCYFDGVGGEISSTIIRQMNARGRVCVCGSISVYHKDDQLPKVTILQPAVLAKQLIIEGFSVFLRNQGQWDVAIKELAKWIMSGQLKAPEHVTEGFDNIYEALAGMYAGENIGKAVVKIKNSIFDFN